MWFAAENSQNFLYPYVVDGDLCFGNCPRSLMMSRNKGNFEDMEMQFNGPWKSKLFFPLYLCTFAFTTVHGLKPKSNE